MERNQKFIHEDSKVSCLKLKKKDDLKSNQNKIRLAYYNVEIIEPNMQVSCLSI